MPIAGGELRVRADFDHSSGVEHHNAIGGGGLGQPVRHDERGPALQRAQRGRFQCAGTGAAGFGGGLVEDGYQRVGQHDPGQRELLSLGCAEPLPARADHCGETVGQDAHPAQGSDPVQRGHQLLIGGVRTGQPQVGGQRTGEGVHLLGDERDDGPRGRRVQRGDLYTADPDLPGGRRVHPGDELGEGGLACAAGADQRDPLPGPQGEIDISDYLVTGRVGVPDAGDDDRGICGPAGLSGQVGTGQLGDAHQPGQAGGSAG